MTELERQEKTAKTIASRNATKQKRESQSCCVFRIKIDESHLSSKQKECLKMIFNEAKWIYNSLVAFSQNNDISDFAIPKNTVLVKGKDGNIEERELKYIGSQMKQSIKDQAISNVKGLSTLKKRKKQEPGKLKFKSTCTSVLLKQYGKTYSIVSPKQICIQKIPGRLRVNGLDQFFGNPEYEIANAKLLNTPLGYYVDITAFKKKGGEKEELISGDIGIDLGIATTITLSNGEKMSAAIEETERLKRLSRKMNRQEKGSNNRKKTQKLIDREYQRISNRKEDVANKIVHYLLQYEHVCMQDENLRGWHSGLFGKQVQHSVLGRIKTKLLREDRSDRVFCLDSRVPTTQYCPICGRLNKHNLSERTYECFCEYVQDRDVHAAQNMVLMVREGYPLKDKKDTKAEEKLKALYRDRYLGDAREVTPMEIEPLLSRQYREREMIVRASSVCEVGRSRP